MSKLWFAAALLLAGRVLAQDPREIMNRVQRKTQVRSQHYEGTLQVIDTKRNIAEKRWRYDRFGSAGESKALLRFTAPAEVKGVALLVHNHADRASDQWMWTPATNRERRIALQDRSTRFFGTDFSFEDLEERDVDQYEYRMLGEQTIDGVKCWQIESRPKQAKNSQYTRTVVWVRQDHDSLAQVESYKGDKLARRLRYTNYEQVQNIWTARQLEMFDADRNSRTILKLDQLQYNVPLQENEFTVQALRRES